MDDVLISRAAVLQICRDAVPDTNPDNYDMSSRDGYGSWMHSNGEACAATRIQASVESLPSAAAETAVHAYWRTIKDGSLECTNCGAQSPHDENYYGDIICNYETDYCPRCGAKMDGGQEGD